MPGQPVNLLKRIVRHFIKTVTFDGTTWGDVGTDTIATVTGRVLLTHMSAYCSTSLTGSTATIELGSPDNTASLIAQTTAEDLDTSDFWRDATPEVDVVAATTDMLFSADIFLTTRAAAVTAGVIEFVFLWLPISVDGNLA